MYLPVVLVLVLVLVVVVVVVVFVVVVIVVIVVMVITIFVYSHTQKYCGHQHLSRRACLSWGAASYLLLEFFIWEPGSHSGLQTVRAVWLRGIAKTSSSLTVAAFAAKLHTARKPAGRTLLKYSKVRRAS